MAHPYMMEIHMQAQIERQRTKELLYRKTDRQKDRQTDRQTFVSVHRSTVSVDWTQ